MYKKEMLPFYLICISLSQKKMPAATVGVILLFAFVFLVFQFFYILGWPFHSFWKAFLGFKAELLKYSLFLNCVLPYLIFKKIRNYGFFQYFLGFYENIFKFIYFSTSSYNHFESLKTFLFNTRCLLNFICTLWLWKQ